MASKTVEHTTCICGKRGFSSERLADKALGRATSKRNRAFDSRGSRRGMNRESRWYECDMSDLLHLTGESKRSFNERTVPTLTWEHYLAEQAA